MEFNVSAVFLDDDTVNEKMASARAAKIEGNRLIVALEDLYLELGQAAVGDREAQKVRRPSIGSVNDLFVR